VRIRRKDIRQPDEFVTLTAQVATWGREHQPLLLAALGLLVALGLVVLVVARARATRDERAGVGFRAAYRTFQSAKYADAAAAFASVAAEYPQAPYGRLATLYRGHALARQGDAAGAASAYGEYLASSPPTAYLRQEALAGLGHAREASAAAAGAVEAYSDAGALDGPFKTDALLGAARLHEAAGRQDVAREIYGRLMGADPAPELRSLLASKLPAGATPAKAAAQGQGAESQGEPNGEPNVR
jgi:tetratricopeptide (TPR) repeat protein